MICTSIYYATLFSKRIQYIRSMGTAKFLVTELLTIAVILKHCSNLFLAPKSKQKTKVKSTLGTTMTLKSICHFRIQFIFDWIHKFNL